MLALYFYNKQGETWKVGTIVHTCSSVCVCALIETNGCRNRFKVPVEGGPCCVMLQLK